MTFNRESAHTTHDALLIASYKAGDGPPADRALAELRIRECADCRALHDDLAAIGGALAALPRVATAPRDFRLSAEQAARLRGGPWWRRVARTLVAPRGLGRPLATAFTTLGLVGLLIGSLPMTALPLAGFAGDRTSLEAKSSDGAGGQAPAPQANPGDASWQYGPSASHAVQGEGSGSAQETDGPEAVTDGDGRGGTLSPTTARDLDATASPTISPVSMLALAFLAVGLALFGLRRFGRRLS